jgi:hypothetical protein
MSSNIKVSLYHLSMKDLASFVSAEPYRSAFAAKWDFQPDQMNRVIHSIDVLAEGRKPQLPTCIDSMSHLKLLMVRTLLPFTSDGVGVECITLGSGWEQLTMFESPRFWGQKLQELEKLADLIRNNTVTGII